MTKQIDHVIQHKGKYIGASVASLLLALQVFGVPVADFAKIPETNRKVAVLEATVLVMHTNMDAIQATLLKVVNKLDSIKDVVIRMDTKMEYMEDDIEDLE